MSLSKSPVESRASTRSAKNSSNKVDNSSEIASDFEAIQQQEATIIRSQGSEELGQFQKNSNEASPELTFLPYRVFINHIDSYHGKKFAEFLPGREPRIQDQDGGENSNVDEDADDWRGNSEEDTNLSADKVETTSGKLEVIGTVKNKEYKQPEDVAMVIRTTKNRELLLRELMKCGVVIYDITQDDSQIEEANWALEAIVDELLRSRREVPKAFERSTETRYFFLISTMMTWALTKPLDPENPDSPFTEADYRKRRPHPNFKEHIKCEKNVVTIAKRNELNDKFKTFVIGSGITYGDEEGPLHYLFKMAWDNADYLPIFGNGANKIPLLHVRDLVEVVYMLMKKPPKSKYIVAVEPELIPQATLVKKISKALGTGKVEFITPEDAFLFPELSQRSYDMANININVVPGFIAENELQWDRGMPFRDKVDYLVEEYKRSRNLKPLKIIIVGPPASGKTILARKLGQHYGIHYIHVKSLIEETIQKLSKEIEATAMEVWKKKNTMIEFEDSDEEDEDERNTPRLNHLQAELAEIRANLSENGGRLNDDILNKLFKNRLLSKDCQNQGYVIDGYPKTLSQAKSLFETDDDDDVIEESESDISDDTLIGTNRQIMPEFVIVLEASDEFLIERVIRLPEKEIQRTHYNEEGMLRRLKEYRERNTDEESPLQFFDELEIHPLFINVEDDVCPEMFSVFVRCIERLGEPRNYGPSDLEREATKKRVEAEALANLKIEAARKDREDLERKRAREIKITEWKDLMDKLNEEEEAQLLTLVEPLRHYLVKYIFPTLTKGLIEVAKLRPKDPVDFLAEYLFRENPEGKMFEPDYTETISMLLNAIDNVQEKILPSNELNSEQEKYLKVEEHRRRDQSGEACRISSNDETTTLTKDDEDNENDENDPGGKRKVQSEETTSDIDIIRPHSPEGIYPEKDSDPMIASSFSYEPIAEDSRTSFENSSNFSLRD